MNNLSVSYILHTPIPRLITYAKGQDDVNPWIGIHMNMRALLNKAILANTLEQFLGIPPSESLLEAIMTYPDHNIIDKDVTVVFTY